MLPRPPSHFNDERAAGTLLSPALSATNLISCTPAAFPFLSEGKKRKLLPPWRDYSPPVRRALQCSARDWASPYDEDLPLIGEASLDFTFPTHPYSTLRSGGWSARNFFPELPPRYVVGCLRGAGDQGSWTSLFFHFDVVREKLFRSFPTMLRSYPPDLFVIKLFPHNANQNSGWVPVWFWPCPSRPSFHTISRTHCIRMSGWVNNWLLIKYIPVLSALVDVLVLKGVQN